MHVTPEVHDRITGLLDTIREAVLYLIHTDSPNLRRLMADALTSVEADLPGDTAVSTASDSIHALLGGPLPEASALAALKHYEQAVTTVLTPTAPPSLAGESDATDAQGPGHAPQNSTSWHPYAALPQRAIWRKAVAERHALCLEDLYRKKFSIASDAPITTAGSCFAQYIGQTLKKNGFNFRDFEPAPSLFPAEQARKYNYGVYSARYCNIYTARQLLQLLSRAFGGFIPREAAWEKDGGVVDPFRPLLEPDPFGSMAELERSRQSHLAAVRELFEKTELLIFTLGLTEAWVSKVDGAVFPLCPGTVGGTFDGNTHAFANFNYSEVVEDLVSLVTHARSTNRNIRFMLTVSPVPLTATKSGHPVLAATMYSKSVLRAVAGHLSSELDAVDYFPAYEIIAAPSMRGMFYEPNMRTITPAGVDHVMSHFLRQHASVATGKPMTTSLPSIGNHEAVCEEMLQAQGLGYA
ncbi:GSCFA domain-containing protein [Thermomonas brevis]